MTIILWVFIATLIGNPAPKSFTFTDINQCIAMSGAMTAAGHDVTGCAPLHVTVAVTGR
jgi:hypothetical protein